MQIAECWCESVNISPTLHTMVTLKDALIGGEHEIDFPIKQPPKNIIFFYIFKWFKCCTKPKFKLFFDYKMYIAATTLKTSRFIFKQGSAFILLIEKNAVETFLLCVYLWVILAKMLATTKTICPNLTSLHS